MIEQFAKGILEYCMADPIRTLVLIIIMLSSIIILNHKANLRSEFERIREELKTYSSNILLIQATIESKSSENIRMAQVLMNDLKEFSFALSNLKAEIATDKGDMLKRLFEVSFSVEKFQRSIEKVADIKQDLDNQFGKVIVIENNYDLILKKLAEMKKK